MLKNYAFTFCILLRCYFNKFHVLLTITILKVLSKKHEIFMQNFFSDSIKRK
eukprot:UN24392